MRLRPPGARGESVGAGAPGRCGAPPVGAARRLEPSRGHGATGRRCRRDQSCASMPGGPSCAPASTRRRGRPGRSARREPTGRRPSDQADPPDAIRRVLVRFPNWLGDTVMALPTLRALRGALPAAELWCLGPWARHPPRERARHRPASRAARGRGAPGSPRPAVSGRRGFDLALILPNSFETALAGWLARARWRVGYAGEGRALLLTHALRPDDGPVHQVAAYLRLLGPLGVAGPPTTPTLAIDPARRAEARRLLGETGLPPGDAACRHPARRGTRPVEALAARADRRARDATRGARGPRRCCSASAGARGLADAVAGGGRGAVRASSAVTARPSWPRSCRSSTRSSPPTAGPPTSRPRSGCRR